MPQAVTRALTPTVDKCKRENLGIQPNRPVADVIEVMLQSVFKTRIATPAMDLSISGQSRAHKVPNIIEPMFLAKLGGELGPFGTWPHNAHVAPKDIPELRQFIQAKSPKYQTKSGASRIVRYRPDRTVVFFGVEAHCPECDYRKTAPLKAHPNLSIEDWSAVLQLDSGGDCQQNGKEHDDPNRRKHTVNRPLDNTGDTDDRSMRIVGSSYRVGSCARSL